MADEHRYESPEALERALSDRLRTQYPGNQLQNRRNEVAYRRLLARMQVADPDKWVLKGGVGLILRLDPNRSSNDIDVTYVDQAGEHAVALEALHRAVEVDLDDFFSFEIARVGEETPDRARRVTVLARLGAREFARFRVDLAVPTVDLSVERVSPPPLTGIVEIDATPPLLALAWPQQLAEKICAIFEDHSGEPSSRPRDLADVAMIARQIDGLAAIELSEALLSERDKRPDTLPNGLPTQLVLPEHQADQWSREWTRATRSAPITFKEALAVAQAFVGPLLAGSATGHWSVSAEAYR